MPASHVSAAAYEGPNLEALPKSKSFVVKVFYCPLLSFSRPVQRRLSLPEEAGPHAVSGVHRECPAAGAYARLAFRDGVPVALPRGGVFVMVPVSSCVLELLLSSSLLSPSQ